MTSKNWKRNLEKYLHVFYCWKMGRTLLSQDQYCRIHSRFKEQVWSLVSPPSSSKAGRINNFCLHCSFNNPIIPSYQVTFVWFSHWPGTSTAALAHGRPSLCFLGCAMETRAPHRPRLLVTSLEGFQPPKGKAAGISFPGQLGGGQQMLVE